MSVPPIFQKRMAQMLFGGSNTMKQNPDEPRFKCPNEPFMTKVYHSKIGALVVVPLLLGFGTAIMASAREPSGWITLVLLSPALLFVAHLFFTTKYTITGQQLMIRAGFFYRKTIDIQQIKKISETRNPLSSPALSLDRLDIRFGKFDAVMISPKEKSAFVAHLLNLHPEIEVKDIKGRRTML